MLSELLTSDLDGSRNGTRLQGDKILLNPSNLRRDAIGESAVSHRRPRTMFFEVCGSYGESNFMIVCHFSQTRVAPLMVAIVTRDQGKIADWVVYKKDDVETEVVEMYHGVMQFIFVDFAVNEVIVAAEK